MTRLGLILILACALGGAMYHFWTEKEKPAAPPATAPGKAKTSAQAKAEYGPYMTDLERRIKRAWFPPKSGKSNHTKVEFRVKTDGTIAGVHILKSSTSASADKAALKAVTLVSPVRPLPAGAPDEVYVQFTFDYNVIHGEDKSISRK